MQFCTGDAPCQNFWVVQSGGYKRPLPGDQINTETLTLNKKNCCHVREVETLILHASNIKHIWQLLVTPREANEAAVYRAHDYKGLQRA